MWAGLSREAQRVITNTTSSSSAASRECESPLTCRDIDRLTLYKWQYTLQTRGFSRAEIRQVQFLKWLYLHGGVKS